MLLWTNLRLFLRGSISTLAWLETGRWEGHLVQSPSLSVQLTAWRSKPGHPEAGNTWCFNDRGKSSRCLKMVWALHAMGSIRFWHAPWCYGWNENHLPGSFPLLTPSSPHDCWAHIDFGPWRYCWFDKYLAETSSLGQIHGRTGDFFAHCYSANIMTGAVKMLTLPRFVDVHVCRGMHVCESKCWSKIHSRISSSLSKAACLPDTLQQHRRVQMRFE